MNILRIIETENSLAQNRRYQTWLVIRGVTGFVVQWFVLLYAIKKIKMKFRPRLHIALLPIALFKIITSINPNYFINTCLDYLYCSVRSINLIIINFWSKDCRSGMVGILCRDYDEGGCNNNHPAVSVGNHILIPEDNRNCPVAAGLIGKPIKHVVAIRIE